MEREVKDNKLQDRSAKQKRADERAELRNKIEELTARVGRRDQENAKLVKDNAALQKANANLVEALSEAREEIQEASAGLSRASEALDSVSGVTPPNSTN